MRISYIAAAALAALAAAACGDDERFRIAGTIEGAPTMNLRVSYMSDGRYVSMITAAREGAFEIQGSSADGTIVEISDYDDRVLGRTYAANGQELELTLDPSNPWNIKASGNETASEWAAFLRDNASLRSDADAVNESIGRYVGSNPGSLVSTLLLITSYDAASSPAVADSLMELIEPAARPALLTEGFNYLLQRMVAQGAESKVEPFRYLDRQDSIRLFSPSEARYSLLVFDNNRSGRSDSIVEALRKLKSYRKERLQVLEVSFDSDTTEWKRSTRRDTATWTQTWAAGGFAASNVSRLAVPALPYFIVADSAGTQILRTHSVAAASDTVKALLSQD